MLSHETDTDPYKHARLDYHATVRELPSHERPRERLQHFGPQALSQAELLAIVLRTGTRGDNALELANKLLAKYGGQQFLQKRQEMPYAKQKSYLFISNISRLDDKPVRKEFVSRKVQSFAHYSPQRLRVTCFAALTEHYGPQYLVEAFGLSLSQAARYGNMEEFLLEEEVKQQREAFQKNVPPTRTE